MFAIILYMKLTFLQELAKMFFVQAFGPNNGNPATMVGLVLDRVNDDEVTEDFEQKGFVWMDKEKMVPGPFYIPEYDEFTGDRKFTNASSVLTTTTYNLDSDLHRIETKVRNDAQICQKKES